MPHPAAAAGWLGEHPLGLLFSGPYIVFVLVIFAYPIVFAVWMSFQDYFFAAPGAVVDRPFVGFANYVAVLQDPKVWQSFGNVGIFLLINVPLTVVFSLLLAYGLNTIIHAGIFFRISYYVPYVTASVAIVAVWLFLFSRDGLVNQVLGPLAPEPSWLVNSALAMPTIALFVTWKGMAFYILLYLAALQNVSKELYEAASVDGAAPCASSSRSRCPVSVRRRSSCCCSPRSRGRTCSRSPTSSPAVVARTAPPRRPCC